MIRTPFFLGVFFTTFFAMAQPTQLLDKSLEIAQQKKLYERPEWIHLVHYKKTIWGGWQSEADGRYFFVSPNGHKNPQQELEATVRGFFSDQKRVFEGEKFPAQSTRCQFPARWIWLSRELGLKESDINSSDCAEYEYFKQKVMAKSATLVFASYNINNPSSTFGHSLLRFNRNEHGKGLSLLDVGINYAANPWTTNPVLYGVLGLSGFFPGTFAAMQYFYKVREYSDFDSRDLWEYDLNLTQDELDLATAHVWELGFTHFNYYFFTSNCSYHMLTLLDVASPRLHLTEKLPFWVIPADTIKTVWETNGLVANTVYRPSLNKQFYARLELLQSDEEFAAYRALTTAKYNTEVLPSSLSQEAKARVLDAAIDKYDIENFSKLITENEDIKKVKNQLLIARSRLPAAQEIKYSPPQNERPHISHDSARFSYSHLIDADTSENGYEITQRFALHDFLDPLDGYPNSAKIEFFKFTVNGSYKTNEFFIRNIDALSVQTIHPLSKIEKPWSWKMRIGLDRVQDQRCVDGCLSGTGEGAFGISLPVNGTRTILYTLAQGYLRTSPDFKDDKVTAEVGPHVGLRHIFSSRLIFNAESEWQWIVGKDQSINTIQSRLRWAPRLDWAVEMGYRKQFWKEEYLASLYHYF